ncbi:MAG: response regulator [Saprospiraceae bacterium]|nr:response regulator [Saprospiraceae bacterium]
MGFEEANINHKSIHEELEYLRGKLVIENALNNVRTAFSELQLNDDLHQCLTAFVREMMGVGLEVEDGYLYHFDETAVNSQQLWLFSNQGGKLTFTETTFEKLRHFFIHELANSEDAIGPIFRRTFSGDEKLKLIEDFYSSLKKGDQKSAETETSSGISMVGTIAKNSGIGLLYYRLAPLDDVQTELLKRFGNVLEEAFVRFLDLKRAKEQAKKAQIEVALERIRNRSMLMNHTSELQDVVNLVSQQLISLEVNINGGAFITINDEVDEHVPIWGCGGATSFAQKAVVYHLDRPIFTNLQQSIIERRPFMTEVYTRAEKIEFFEHLYRHSPWDKAPDELKEKLLNSEGGYARSAVISPNTCIFIINNTGQVFSEQSNDILKRFGVVFEQAYTRFLDLQRAEAQAREAQIETALERVRSASLAMHQSKDLYQVVSATYQQMMHLNLLADVCVIFDELDHPSALHFWATTSEISIPEKIMLPIGDQEVINRIHQACKSRPRFFEIQLNFDQKNRYYQYVFDHSEPGNLIGPARKEKVLAAPGLSMLISFMSNSALSIHNYEGLQYDESEKQLLRRMHHVFEQAYIRFLDLQKSEEQAKRLKELEVAKARFYTNITHEFRTPLTVISGMADQISNHPGDWLDEGVSMIRRNAQRLLELVNQMLELNKLESGKVSLFLQQADIVKYLRYLTYSLISLADEKGIDLRFESGVEVLMMDFDKEKIQKVMINLLSNAIKFTPENGIVRVELNVRNEAVNGMDRALFAIKIKDSGIGIAKDHLPHIFDRFYQIDDSHTRSTEGSGIGLSLVQELVQVMGGTIGVKSVPGKGTEFECILPIHQDAEITQVIESFELEKNEEFQYQGDIGIMDDQVFNNTHQNRPRILLIEDNQDVVAYVASCLYEEYEIQVGKDGAEGIEIAIDELPDLIVTDVMMPLKDGFEVCQTLKNDVRTSHIPIIMLTAKADIESKIEGLQKGADAYLEKPFHKEELQVRIKMLLQLRTNLQKYYLAMATRESEESQDLMAVPEVIPEKDALFVQLKALVLENLKDYEYSVDHLCKAAAMSHSQLHRKISALTGLSPIRFIRHIRLSRAKILLEKSDMVIKMIAYETGFNDPGYFARIFKQEMGLTPLQWKEQRQKSELYNNEL